GWINRVAASRIRSRVAAALALRVSVVIVRRSCTNWSVHIIDGHCYPCQDGKLSFPDSYLAISATAPVQERASSLSRSAVRSYSWAQPPLPPTSPWILLRREPSTRSPTSDRILH